MRSCDTADQPTRHDVCIGFPSDSVRSYTSRRDGRHEVDGEEGSLGVPSAKRERPLSRQLSNPWTDPILKDEAGPWVEL